MGIFKLKSDYQPTGDQPEAIRSLTEGVLRGDRMQTLLGVTGSGKTFTMANVIANVGRPTLVLAHNKTLAAQLCSEFREFFPENAVEYFVSYYDYYQPEAYLPGKDMYIEKDALINDEIDKLRHSATSALFERRDVIIVASVSCIYSLGDPSEYESLLAAVRPGMQLSRDELIRKLIAAVVEQAKQNKTTILPGYTHLQRAQPIVFAHHLLAYAMMLMRDVDRIEDAVHRMNRSPLGSCALAGTTYNTDRYSVAKALGFDGITENSIDGVSDRDFALELMSVMPSKPSASATE